VAHKLLGGRHLAAANALDHFHECWVFAHEELRYV
jgi:hypothetical protein